MNWTTIAIAAPLTCVAWLILTEWVPMFPLNDLEGSTVKERVQNAAINYPVIGSIGILFWTGTVWGAWTGLVLAGVVLVGHLMSWWLPYFGFSFKAQRDAYEHEFGRTLKILPTKGHDVTIDVQHMVVGVLVVAGFVAAFVTTIRMMTGA